MMSEGMGSRDFSQMSIQSLPKNLSIASLAMSLSMASINSEHWDLDQIPDDVLEALDGSGVTSAEYNLLDDAARRRSKPQSQRRDLSSMPPPSSQPPPLMTDDHRVVPKDEIKDTDDQDIGLAF